MKINGIEFINDHWDFYGGNNAALSIERKCWVGSEEFTLTLNVVTKRDRTTPLSVHIMENDFLPFEIPKCKDWEFLSDSQLFKYIKEQLDIRKKNIDRMKYCLLYFQ